MYLLIYLFFIFQFYCICSFWKVRIIESLVVVYFNVLYKNKFIVHFSKNSFSQRSGYYSVLQTSGIYMSTWSVNSCVLGTRSVCCNLGSFCGEMSACAKWKTIIRHCHLASGEIKCAGLCRFHWRETCEDQVFQAVWLRVIELHATHVFLVKNNLDVDKCPTVLFHDVMLVNQESKCKYICKHKSHVFVYYRLLATSSRNLLHVTLLRKFLVKIKFLCPLSLLAELWALMNCNMLKFQTIACCGLAPNLNMDVFGFVASRSTI
jgi:hypothetical protein